MKQFDVTMKCIVYKAVTVECETIEQARENPWDYAVDEMEMDQVDWEILSIKECD